MDPVSIVSAALGIAKATGLTDWIGEKLGGEPGAKAAGKIVDVATAVTGAKSPEDAIKRIQADQDAANAVRQKLLEHQQELVRLQFQDLQNARAMYAQKSKMADRIAEHVIRWNLPAVVLLVVANCFVIMYIRNATIAVAVGNIIGASIAYLWQERHQVITFFFGSSLGSKQKTEKLLGREPVP